MSLKDLARYELRQPLELQQMAHVTTESNDQLRASVGHCKNNRQQSTESNSFLWPVAGVLALRHCAFA